MKTTFEKMAQETSCPFAQLSHGFECMNRGVPPQAQVSETALDTLMGKVGLRKSPDPKPAAQVAHDANAEENESALVPPTRVPPLPNSVPAEQLQGTTAVAPSPSDNFDSVSPAVDQGKAFRTTAQMAADVPRWLQTWRMKPNAEP